MGFKDFTGMNIETHYWVKFAPDTYVSHASSHSRHGVPGSLAIVSFNVM
jgi:hypothetical protein